MKAPKSTGFIQTPLLLEIPFATINGTCYPRHHIKYSDQDVGLLSVFMAAGRLNLDITDNNKSISIIAQPWEDHVSSSDALHDNTFFKIRPASLYIGVKMKRVQTLKLLCRTGHLCRVEMDPVDFQMITTHLEKASSGDPSIFELYAT
jgi:hypothetical protein